MRLQETGRALTARSLIIGLALLILANIWMKYAALITLSTQVTMSVPPITALMALILLLALHPLSRLFRLTRRELLFIYVFLTLSVALTSGGALRSFLPQLTASQYFATPQNEWAEFQQYVPWWMAPKDPEVIRTYYEGTNQGVPWKHWVVPLTSWSIFFLLLLGSLLCVALLFYDEWSQRERLTFPLTELPLSMTSPHGVGHKIPQLWRDPVMWIGFGLAALYNGLNIAHAYNPAIPCLEIFYPMWGVFTQNPWRALNDIVLEIRPEVLGLGYMMPQDVVVSSVIFYGLLKAEAVGALILGYDIIRFPHMTSQASGSFVAFALFLIFMSRHRLAQIFTQAISGEGKAAQRWAAWGLLVGLIGMWLWWRAAGMSTLTITLFFGTILLMALTYARIRSETGLPLQWGYPVGGAGRILTAAFGSDLFKHYGGVRNLTVYYTTWFLTRGYLPNLSAYHFEGLKIAHEGGIRRREIVLALLLAIVLGMAVSYWVHIDTYYAFGANFLEGGTGGGGQRVRTAVKAFDLLQDAAGNGIQPHRGETLAFIWGALATIILTIVRANFLRFPLHHLGFIIGVTRAYVAWGSLLPAAIVKALAVRLGGVRLYRRLVPGAIGVVLGHFVVAGGVWTIIALFGGEAFGAYKVWFG